ncbi:hypothetical protein GFS31_13230 [Leptolyngbya sp. BL0902]|nr:hypothetical protein GFS31_13230 [Leptolyngbya sp. BL0902]
MGSRIQRVRQGGPDSCGQTTVSPVPECLSLARAWCLLILGAESLFSL